jgi:trigger factor
MTDSTLTRLAPTTVTVEFALTEAELAAAEERAFRRLSKSVRLPGFRKGRVPRKLFDQTYGPEAVRNEAVDEVVPERYAQAIREHDLDPVERPKIEIVEEAEGRPTRMRATVEVRPEIELGTYKGVMVSRPPIGVADEDVERSLAALAKERATLVPVERTASLGDVVTIDYEGSMQGTPFEGGSGVGQVVELAEGRFVPGFTAGIEGMRAGETRQIQATFPAEYPAADLAGKTADFSVTLHEVKELDPPVIDDDFARAVSQNETVAQLREDIRKRLEAVAAGRARRATGNAVMNKLMSAHDFPLPPTLVENELNRILEDVRSPGGEETSETQLREMHRKDAESRVKAGLLIAAIAKAENISATPADLAAELEVLARRYGQPAARIREALGHNLVTLIDGIVRNKTLDLLIDNAVVTVDEETSRTAS